MCCADLNSARLLDCFRQPSAMFYCTSLYIMYNLTPGDLTDRTLRRSISPIHPTLFAADRVFGCLLFVSVPKISYAENGNLTVRFSERGTSAPSRRYCFPSRQNKTPPIRTDRQGGTETYDRCNWQVRRVCGNA